MLRMRTKSLLALMVLSGVAIGLFSGIADGMYSAISLFLLPILVALAAVSIIVDLSTQQAVKAAVVRKKSPKTSGFRLPKTA